MQYVLLDLAQRQIRFICAGHPPILLRRAPGQIAYLGVIDNIPLGIDATFVYQHETQQLLPGDTVLLYSDGAYELWNRQGDMFGLPRLAALFALAPVQPAAIIQYMQASINAFSMQPSMPPSDDTTFLCARLT